MTPLSTEIESLGYHTVERAISNYFDLGMVNSSEFPPVLCENESGTYFIDGTRRYGDFNIRIAKQTNGKYWLYASAHNIKKHR